MTKLSDNKVSAVTSQNYTGVATAGQTVIIPGFTWRTTWTGRALYISGVKQALDSYTINSIGGGLSSQITLSEALVGGEVIDFAAMDVSSIPSLQGVLDAQCLGGVGECRLDYTSATVLTLSRYNGHRLVIDNVTRSIPAAGVTLANSGVADTTYYIYAYWTGSTVALEYSTTGHAADSRNGVRIKTGNATRTLVGMARTTASGQWNSSLAQRFVLSYYNRTKLPFASAGLSTDTTTSSTTPVVVSSIRCDFITWSDYITLYLHTRVKNASIATNSTGIYMDGATLNQSMILTDSPIINSGFSDSGYHSFFVNEGRHYIDACVSVFSGTGTWPSWSTYMISEVMG